MQADMCGQSGATQAAAAADAQHQPTAVIVVSRMSAIRHMHRQLHRPTGAQYRLWILRSWSLPGMARRSSDKPLLTTSSKLRLTSEGVLQLACCVVISHDTIPLPAPHTATVLLKLLKMLHC